MSNKLRSRISSNLNEYSRIQRKLAVFLDKYWNDIPLMSIEQIARQTGVSMATITRFVRRFGFQGFFQFKAEIKKQMTGRINPVDRFRLLKADFSGKESLVKVANQDVKNINRLLEQVREEMFTGLVKRIEAASRVFTFGVSVSAIFSRIFSYSLNQVRKESYCLDDGAMTVEEKIFNLNRDDLIVFSSFYPYSKCTVDYAQLAQREGVPVVAISDDEYSPVSQYAGLTLALPSENILYTTSVSAFSVLVNAVVTEIALKKKEELADRIHLTDKKLKKFYILS